MPKMSTTSRKLCDCTEDNTKFMSFDNVCCDGKVVDVYDGENIDYFTRVVEEVVGFVL
jgi:predicted phage tail protein